MMFGLLEKRRLWRKAVDQELAASLIKIVYRVIF